jgi:hypothetical protein
MSYFMQDNEHHAYVCIDSMHEHVRIFVINFFKFYVMPYCTKVGLVKLTEDIFSKGFIRNLICIFQIFCEFM